MADTQNIGDNTSSIPKNQHHKLPSIHVEAKGIWSAMGRFFNSPTGKTLILVGVSALGINLVNRKVRYIRQKSAFKETLDYGSAENIAMRIKNAMGMVAWGSIDWDGTDEAAVKEAISEVETKKDWDKVRRAYGKLTQGRSLEQDLNKELGQADLEQIYERILGNKPESKNAPIPDNSKIFAQDLKEAITYTYSWFNIPDTDLDGIFDALHAIPNQEIWEKTKEEYAKISYSGKDLWTDLGNENRLKSSFNDLGMFTSWYSTYYQNSSLPIINILKNLAIKKFGNL